MRTFWSPGTSSRPSRGSRPPSVTFAGRLPMRRAGPVRRERDDVVRCRRAASRSPRRRGPPENVLRRETCVCKRVGADSLDALSLPPTSPTLTRCRASRCSFSEPFLAGWPQMSVASASAIRSRASSLSWSSSTRSSKSSVGSASIRSRTAISSSTVGGLRSE
jgi:hypothetical protein